MLLKITLDTNCVINAFDEQHCSATSTEDIEKLFELSQLEQVDVAVTTRLAADLLNDKDPVRRAHVLGCASTIPTVGTVGRWGTSVWDGGDMWVGSRDEGLIEEVQSVLFPNLSKSDKRYSNKINDIDHIVGHLSNDRDIFVTDDGGVWRKRKQLRQKVGVTIMRPSECLKFIESSNSLR